MIKASLHLWKEIQWNQTFDELPIKKKKKRLMNLFLPTTHARQQKKIIPGLYRVSISEMNKLFMV